MKTWKKRVREVYYSLEELKGYNDIYNIAKRCGYDSCKKLWNENPVIGRSVDPKDFGLVKKQILLTFLFLTG